MTRHSALLAALATIGLAHPAAAKDTRVVFIQGVTGNPFYTSVSCGGAEAAKRLGVTFESQGPQQFQPQLQLRVLDAVIASKPDGIMFTATDPVALAPALLQAKEMGIKILSIDGDMKDMSIAEANIQSDNIAGGHQAGAFMAKALDGKGTVMAILNAPAANVAQQRLQGFTDEIAKYPGITYLGVRYSGNQQSKAASIVTATIASNPELSGIYTTSTNNTEGVVTGVREAQRVGKIKLVGFDTSDPIVESIRKGYISADVVQNPYGIGQLGVQNMVDVLAGKKVERQINTQFVLATPENIDTPEVQKFVYKTHCE